MQMTAHIGGKPGGSPLLVLVAVFALLLQTLLPSAAMAAQTRVEGGQIICTSAGMQTVRLDGDGQPAKTFAGLPCADCLAAAAAVVLDEAPAIAIPVAYYSLIAARPGAAERQPVKARPPPRPPSQAPPFA